MTYIFLVLRAISYIKASNRNLANLRPDILTKICRVTKIVTNYLFPCPPLNFINFCDRAVHHNPHDYILRGNTLLKQ